MTFIATSPWEPKVKTKPNDLDVGDSVQVQVHVEVLFQKFGEFRSCEMLWENHQGSRQEKDPVVVQPNTLVDDVVIESRCYFATA